MTISAKGTWGVSLATLLFSSSLLLQAQAATKFVANNGIDSSVCGTTAATACRSISQAIANAFDGDVIVVGPGRYGDLNDDGTFTDPGDESFPGACNCMIQVNKFVAIISRDGAASTILDAAGNGVNVVSISSTGAVFGVLRRGFTLIGGDNGLVVESSASDILVDGNTANGNGNDGFQDLGTGSVFFKNVSTENGNDGFNALGTAPALQNNLATINVNHGFELQTTGAFVRANVSTANSVNGFHVHGANDSSRLTGNIADSNLGDGFRFRNATNIVMFANSTVGNHNFGINLSNLSTNIVIQKNNIFGNAVPAGSPNCGLVNNTPSDFDARFNFWGAPSGPNPAEPSDNICDQSTGVTDTSFPSTREFKIKPGAP